MTIIPPKIGDQREDYRFGMNNYDSPKKLAQHVYQLIQNAYPGPTLKPRNRMLDIKVDETALGYGTKDTFFQQRGIFITAGGKDFVFVWHHNRTTTDEFALEVWNITDDARTKLIYGDFNQTAVYFSMQKLYDALYITMEYEMATNHVSAYRTKNKIVEWDSDASAWAVREMGIDVAPAFQELSIEDTAEVTWEGRYAHSVVFFKGKLWLAGGTDGTNDLPGLYYSSDGVTWVVAANPEGDPYEQRLGFGMCVYDDKLWIAGGAKYSGGFGYYNDVWYSEDGETWTRATAAAAFSARWGHSMVVYNDKMFIIGGCTGASTYTNSVYSSTDGVTWTVVTAAGAFTACFYHTSLVYNDYMWIIGGFNGSGLDDVWYSSDGATWTSATGSAAFGARYAHNSVVFEGKMWVIHGRTASYQDDVYYSTDGATWTQATADTGFADRAYFAACVFDNEIWVWGGYTGSASLNDSYSSSDGVTWATETGGQTPNLYRVYAGTFVRRTDDNAKLSAIGDYRYTIWENWRGRTLVSVDEKLLTGTVSLSGTALTGSGTAFDTELEADDYIRIDGKYKKYKLSSVTDATNAVVVNDDGDSYSAKEFSLLPLADDEITTDVFNPGVVEGVDDIELRQTIFMVPPSTTNGRVFIQIPDATDALAQGATHLRVYRGLGNADKDIAEGLSLRYLVDIALTGNAFTQSKVYRDNTTEAALTGETNLLEMTGYSVPPMGRYSIWAGEVLWIGGNPDNKGHWFYSVKAGTAGVSFDTQFPQKFASMFDLDGDFVTCDPADNQEDTGAAEMLGDLYLFKERKIFVVYGSDPSNVPDKISTTIGCAFPESICNAEITLPNGENLECILFLSESGPAMITVGGKVQLFKRFRIAELWPDKTGILQQSGVVTDWYTRNKVTCAFWDNTWWVFLGDAEDSSCQISTHKTYGFHFGRDEITSGPFEYTYPNYDPA